MRIPSNATSRMPTDPLFRLEACTESDSIRATVPLQLLSHPQLSLYLTPRLPRPLLLHNINYQPDWCYRSVVFGGQDLKTVSEDAPYPASFADPAAASTAAAEQAVLASNAGKTGSNGAMLTCSVRPASLYGPGTRDEQPPLLAGLASRARDGVRLIGDGKNGVDFVYSGNVAHALLLAAEALLLQEDPAGVAGRVFFVTDMEPVPFAEFSDRALSRLGYAASAGSAGIPVLLAAVLAFFLRVVALVVSPVFDFRPALTARRVAEESTVRRFDTSRASKDLGYAPLWSQEVRARERG